MAQSRQGGAGAWGPYPRGRKFAILVRTVSGEPGDFLSFATEAAAARELEAQRQLIAAARSEGRTVATAIDAYERHLEAEGMRQRGETIRRLKSFFAEDLESALFDLSPRHCAAIYESVRQRKATRWVGSGEKRKLVELDKPVSVNTHRGMLTYARTFLSWCVAQRWLRANPLAEVKGKGRLRKGKVQLRIDEARKWEAMAWSMAPTKAGAVAALCELYLGLRASEIVSRQVRDLDDEGQVLVIDDVGVGFAVKTETSRRTVRVGALLRPYMVALTKDGRGKDRAGTELLFGADPRGRPHKRGWPLWWAKKVCAAAGVPLVGAHSMRGLASTLARQQGGTADLVAAALGHAPEVAATHYQQRGTGEAADRRAGLEVLQGGQKGKRKSKARGYKIGYKRE